MVQVEVLNAPCEVLVDDKASLYSDCASVVSVCARDARDRLSGKRAYVGSVLEGFSGASGKIDTVIKVAAHKELDEAGISDAEY